MGVDELIKEFCESEELLCVRTVGTGVFSACEFFDTRSTVRVVWWDPTLVFSTKDRVIEIKPHHTRRQRMVRVAILRRLSKFCRLEHETRPEFREVYDRLVEELTRQRKVFERCVLPKKLKEFMFEMLEELERQHT